MNGENNFGIGEREIEFKYLVRNKETGFIRSYILNLDTIEGQPLYDYELDYEVDEIIARLQYAGLKDKKGKKIFEGDIVKINTSDKIKNNPFVVKWINSECGFNIVEYGLHKCETIGNIYENPELIPETK